MNNPFVNCCDPEKYVSLMFENTDAKTGMLCFHGFDYESSKGDEMFRFHMNWDRHDVDELIKEHRTLVDALRKLSELDPDISYDEAKEIIKDEKLLDIWNTYIRPFSGNGANSAEIGELIMKEEPLTETEKDALDKFYSARIEESKERIGESQFSYNAIIIPMRIRRLMHLEAPEKVIEKEILQLMIVMALHRYCDSREEI